MHGKEDPNAKIAPLLKGQEKQIEGDRFWALRDINLEVKEGEVLGIIGKNGAGKSTLLKILSRVTAPTRGSIKVKGRIASLLEVGTGFHPELTGRENIYLNGAILGMTKLEVKRKLEEIIEFSGVEQYIDTPVKRYSSGMRVRLAFSVAAHLDPEILVIDEVLAVGDAEFQKKCLGKMNEVARAGKTVLFVSHNMASIQNLCGRGVLLESGKVRIDSSVEETIAKYLEQVQKDSATVNLCDREDRGGNGEFRFQKIEFQDFYSDNLLTSILSGGKVKISISYSSKKNIEGVNIAIAFFNSSGSFMCSCSSRVIGKNFNIKSGDGSIYCIMNRFPLAGGRYSYKIYAGFNNVTLDKVNDAGEISVVSGDFYGTGMLPPTNRPGVLVDFAYE